MASDGEANEAVAMIVEHGSGVGAPPLGGRMRLATLVDAGSKDRERKL
jgi:hypothetical protein